MDSDGFFLAPDGRVDPQAELDATLAGFFRGGDAPDRSPQCTFPARYAWLRQVLGFDPDRLPELPCRDLQRWLDEKSVESVSLVFAAAYLNNPASMFGHTFLRLDSRDQGREVPILADVLNYAADSSGERGMAFAVKGLFGGYQGRFFSAPYYTKVKVYGDLENRDLWEYRLRLTGAEVDRLLRHSWELRTARFDYFFSDENCSYQLLPLLDVARPGLDLAGRFPLWVLPSETIRAVTAAGLIDGVTYRPSRRTVLQERAGRLTPPLQDLARGLATGELAPGAPELRAIDDVDQARVLELAVDVAAYRQAVEVVRGKEMAPAPEQVSRLLARRSRLPVPDQTPVVAAPDMAPGDGHRPARLAVGGGFDDRRRFLQFDISPGYHELLDPEGGYSRGAALTALRAAVRYYPERNRLDLERLDLVEIVSLAPWDRILRPLSWNVVAGVGRKFLDPAHRPLVGRLGGGTGISWDITRKLSAYAFAEGTVEVHDRFACFMAPGVGPGGGLILDGGGRWRSGLSVRWQQFFLREWRGDVEATLHGRYFPNRRCAAGGDLGWRRESGVGVPSGRLYWQVYF